MLNRLITVFRNPEGHFNIYEITMVKYTLKILLDVLYLLLGIAILLLLCFRI